MAELTGRRAPGAAFVWSADRLALLNSAAALRGRSVPACVMAGFRPPISARRPSVFDVDYPRMWPFGHIIFPLD
jgi:hypothetical protein